MHLPRDLRRFVGVVLAATAALAACTTGEVAAPDETPPDPIQTHTSATPHASPDDQPTDDTAEPEATCRIDPLEDEQVIWLTNRSRDELAQELTARSFRCASQLVLAPDADPWVTAMAAIAAIHLDAPLFVLETTDADVTTDEGSDPSVDATELPDDGSEPNEAVSDVPSWVSAVDELGVEEVVAIGLSPEDLAADDAFTDEVAVVSIAHEDRSSLARELARWLDVTTLLAVPEDDDRARAAALARATDEIGLLPLPTEIAEFEQIAMELAPTTRLRVLATDEQRAELLTDELLTVGLDAVVASAPLFRTGTTTAWLTDPDDPDLFALTSVAARGRGDVVLPIDGQDLRRGREDSTRLNRAAAERFIITGDVTPDADWQLRTVTQGQPLPGGGFSLFDDRRIVALYGSPETNVLGAMGQQSLDETIPRLREVAAPYGADGLDVLGAFEMIVTIASAAAEDTGDYSRRSDPDLIRSWVERAADEDLYVILDLQPGRTDFLTQAKEFEELLTLPHVGLALDPEWRLQPNQVHLQQIGSVAADEVQEVADWLAELTREHHLPEKLLLLHQFQLRMLPDRDQIVAPAELAVVIHMDGQGTQAAKDETYSAITAGVEDRWLWGWKNFYEKDEPVADPQRVLDLDPVPVFVSYQ